MHGSGFIKSKEIVAKFSWDDKITVNVPVVFKNSTLLGVTIPDLGADCPEGDHLVQITVSLNGQQFSSTKAEFLYKSMDPNLTEEDLKRMDEEDAKNRLKAPPKKK